MPRNFVDFTQSVLCLSIIEFGNRGLIWSHCFRLLKNIYFALSVVKETLFTKHQSCTFRSLVLVVSNN